MVEAPAQHHRPKHVVEYAALRLVAGIVNRLPYRAALAVGWFGAALSYPLAFRRVREAHRRIREVFPNRFSPPQVRRIAWTSWRNIVFDAVEMLRVARITPAWMRATTNCDTALGPLLAHLPTGGGAIIAVPHMGNWETAASACRFASIPIFTVSGRQKNQLVDDYINRLRALPGIEIIPRGSGAMRLVIRRLRAGGFLAIMPDVRVPTDGVPVPFLGGVANIGPGMARFARHSNVPVFPCYITREGWSHQTMHVTEAVWPDLSLTPAEADRQLTAAVLGRIEAWVAAQPDQWFWFNRRWILDPIPAHANPAPAAHTPSP